MGTAPRPVAVTQGTIITMKTVTTAAQLKAAIDAGDEILITDKKLALAVRAVKAAPMITLVGLAAAGTFAAANAWNPIGWSIGTFSFAAGAVGESYLLYSFALLVALLGVGYVWALVRGYDIEATVKAPGGFEVKLKLNPKDKGSV